MPQVKSLKANYANAPSFTVSFIQSLMIVKLAVKDFDSRVVTYWKNVLTIHFDTMRRSTNSAISHFPLSCFSYFSKYQPVPHK